jgi:hypothetical protein
MADAAEKVLKHWQRSWTLLAQSAAWILAVVAGFLVPPPIGTEEEAKVWVRFAQFVATVVTGLALVAGMRWQRRKDTLAWSMISGGALLIATVAFFGYQIGVARWTTNYAGNPTIVGSEWTELGRELRDKKPGASLGELVMDVGGETTWLWTRESVLRRRVALAALYVLPMPLLTLCVIGTVQAVRCASPNPRRRRRRSMGPRRSSRAADGSNAPERITGHTAPASASVDQDAEDKPKA